MVFESSRRATAIIIITTVNQIIEGGAKYPPLTGLKTVVLVEYLRYFRCFWLCLNSHNSNLMLGPSAPMTAM